MKINILTLCFFLVSFFSYSQETDFQRGKMFVDMGYLSGTNNDLDFYNMQFVYGLRANPLLFLGIGCSYRISQINDQKIIAPFVNSKSRLIPSYPNLLVDIGIGFNSNTKQEFNKSGVLFFAGIQNEIPIKKDFNFHWSVNYDVMRSSVSTFFFLNRSVNIKFGISY